MPGDPLDGGSPFTVAGYLRRSVDLVVELLRSAHAGTEQRAGGDPRVQPAGEELFLAIDRVVKIGQLATTAALHEAADLLRAAMGAVFPHAYRGRSEAAILGLVDRIAAVVRRQLDTLVAADVELRRLWQVVDLILAILRGSLRFGLALDPRGFDAINEYDWREWLQLNGASQASVDCGFMRGIYDLAFAFEDGDVARPSLAAGVALRGAMRMFFTYRRALFWRMNGGMGDVVFSPLHEVLERRGARFEFFHRLVDVGLSATGDAAPGELPHVTTLDFHVQAEVKGDGRYRPLFDVDGVPCWPSDPDWSQLVEGDALAAERRDFEAFWDTRHAKTRTLRVGDDFDLVVLGVSLGAIPHVAPQLVARSPRWRRMVESVRTVPTQALQVWMRPGREELGWRGPSVNLSGFVEPFDTWADMTHVAPRERFARPPGHIAYFCSVLPDAYGEAARDRGSVERAHADVRANAVRFLENDVGALWPAAAPSPGTFRWDWLCDPSDQGEVAPIRQGPERLDAQYWRANVNPSDRYVLSVPGSMRHRISPLVLDFDNLTIAGDWTDSGLSTGCIESAVMSGMLAAHALSGSPALESIVGYDHP